MIHHHIKYNNDNVFKSKVAYSSLLYGKVSLSKYILFCKFSFAFRYVMANLMLTFFLYCEYSVQFTDHEVIPSVCVCGTWKGLLAIGRITVLLLVGVTDYRTSTHRLVISNTSSRVQ
jgi:hypothetical protein